jgi:hypothetical protein
MVAAGFIPRVEDKPVVTGENFKVLARKGKKQIQ